MDQKATLFTVEPDPGERRKEQRFQVNFPAQLIDSTDRAVRETPLDAQILDISRSGLKIELWHDAPIGCLFSLSVQSGDEDSLCLCEVMWRRESTKGMIYGLRINHWTYLSPRLNSELSLRDAQKRAISVAGGAIFNLRLA